MLDYRLQHRSPWSKPALDADSRRRRYQSVWRHLIELRCPSPIRDGGARVWSFSGPQGEAGSELDWTLAAASALFRECGEKGEAVREGESAEASLRGLSYYERRPACLLLWGYPSDLVGTLLNVGTVTVYSVLEKLEKACHPRPLPIWTAADWPADRPSPDCLGSRDLERLCFGAFDDKERQAAEAHVESCAACLQRLVLVEEMGHLLRVAEMRGDPAAAAIPVPETP